MTGNPDHVGVLPRTLDVLFNSITDFLAKPCVFTPDGYNQFNVRTEGAAALARSDGDRRRKAAGQGPNPKPPPKTPRMASPFGPS